MDAIASEPQFLDHLAPVWSHLPARGQFLVSQELMDRARAKGIEATPIDVDALRLTPQQPPNRDGMPALVASIGDIKIGRRLGYGPFAFLEHGAGQSYPPGPAAASYAGGPDRADNELFMVPNAYSANLWRRAYPEARVEIVGCPKLDGLPHREGGSTPVVALSFHGEWPSGPYGGNAFPDYSRMLPELARRFDVIGHAHPGKGWAAKVARDFARAGIPFVADFEDVCRQADVYVCDNSSTIFEFAATGRPVVVLNSREWARARGRDPSPPGLRFWDAAHVGINVDRPEDLPAAIEEALADAPAHRAAREDALGLVYGLRTNGAAVAATAVLEWLATKQAVAA